MLPHVLSNGITNVSIAVFDVSLPVNEQNCMKTEALQFFRYVTGPHDNRFQIQIFLGIKFVLQI